MSAITWFVAFVVGVPLVLYGGTWLLSEWQAWRRRRRWSRLTWRR